MMRIAVGAAVLLGASLISVPAWSAEARFVDRLTMDGPAVFMATVTIASGVTAASGTFTASGAAQFSLETASGIKVNAGRVVAPFFQGNGSFLTGVPGLDPTKVLKAGDTMTGALTLAGAPTQALQAATKGYADSWTRACAKPGDGADVMVAAGDLCVDKYEASVWSTPTGGTQYGLSPADYPCGNGATGTGQGCTPAGTPIYARSVAGVTPSRMITWFQANIACANAGKRLLTNSEWQAAAAGTPDPGAGVATPPGCNVNGAAASLTGANTSCLSSYGAENMVGSLWEWTADWGQYGQHYNGAATNWTDGTYFTFDWPSADYGLDARSNTAGRAHNGSSYVGGMPAAVMRGGDWGTGTDAGVFSFNAESSPAFYWWGQVGFRCGRQR